MAEWVMKKLKDIADFNPRESLAKGTVAKKIAMDKLQPFCRDVPGYELEAFSGGTKFRNGDTIMARITPCLENGKTAKVSILDDGEVGFGSTEYIVFRAKEGVDEDFIYYLVCSPLVREPAIKSMVGSSGRQRVQTDVVQNLEIMVPDYEKQRRISGLLKSLDDKIAVNTEVNKNLEEQAQLLFTDRFVVNNYTVAQETKLGTICKCILGGTPSRAKAEYWGGTIPWINSGEINRFRIISPSELITQDGLDHSATKMLPAKTTVLAITGATLGQVSLLEIDACANQSVVGIIPNDSLPYEFIYPFIKAKINELISHQTGGAQQHINKQNVESLPVSIPTKDILDDFVALVSPMYSIIASNCFENMRLENMRDSLLPQLMSGELDVSNIDL
jgi:type I restriction enzyme S subunit